MSSSTAGLVVKVKAFPAGSNFSRGTFDGYKPQSSNGNDGSETLAVIIAGILENVNLSSGKQSGNDEYTTL